jgi:hypothetical protein
VIELPGQMLAHFAISHGLRSRPPEPSPARGQPPHLLDKSALDHFLDPRFNPRVLLVA